MPKIIKNTILNYLFDYFEIENIINPNRIFKIKNKPINKNPILYLCERELRADDNPALQFAIQKSNEFNLPLKIIHPKINYEHKPKQNFINKQIKQTQNTFNKLNLDFLITDKTPFEIIKNINPSILILILTRF